MRPRISGRWIAALMLCAGCGNNPYFDDDEGAARQDTPALGAHPDHLSLPYAAGSHIGITVHKAQADWRVQSDTPSVFSIDKMSYDDGTISADCTAGVPGVAKLTLVDAGGSEQRGASVNVATPDGAKIIAHGPARLLGARDANPAVAEITEARVLTGGTGVVAVAYFRGTQRLYGHSLIQVTPPAGLRVENRIASGLPVNEFLFLKPTVDGAYSLDLGAGGQRLATLPVTAVPATEVAALTLEEETGGSRNDNDRSWVLAQARDGAGKPIYGAYSTWTLGGVAQLASDEKTTAGDLYRYNINPGGAKSDLVASIGTARATLSIQAHSGQVNDTTYLGCSVAHGRPAGSGTVLAAMIGVVLAVCIRRRRTN